MSSFKKRTDYYKQIAHYNKLIAHDRQVDDGSVKLRKSFHRINDDDELNAACVNWAHFPCVVHEGYEVFPKQNITGMPRKVVRTHLNFLSKIDSKTYPFLGDAIEAAYDEAYTAMAQFMAKMVKDVEEEGGCCGELFLFELNRAQSYMVGPINSNLYGWHLQFEDETKEQDFVYDIEDWFENN